MTNIRFVALSTTVVSAYQQGDEDANGQPPERLVARTPGAPCRHCLGQIEVGEPFLVLAHRPFPKPQPYAEIGPIFLHAESCPQGGNSATIPAFLDSPSYIIRGYSSNHRIVYGSGGVVATANIPQKAAELFEDETISYLHVRSAANNCYHCRIERA